jgi:hypothetical protein
VALTVCSKLSNQKNSVYEALILPDKENKITLLSTRRLFRSYFEPMNRAWSQFHLYHAPLIDHYELCLFDDPAHQKCYKVLSDKFAKNNRIRVRLVPKKFFDTCPLSICAVFLYPTNFKNPYIFAKPKTKKTLEVKKKARL